MNQASGAASLEIGIVFPNSGLHAPPSISPSPIISHIKPASSSRSSPPSPSRSARDHRYLDLAKFHWTLGKHPRIP
uniref:Uncharacterized protein n=1 Tax=Oryza glumipatula TaxID=40148 RepID=A0A0D9ZIR4_9ORYZ